MEVFFRILLVLYIIGVAFLCFATFDQTVPTLKWTLFDIPSDKLGHFLMFLPFPVLCFFSFPYRGVRLLPCLLSVLAIFAVGAAFAGATELIQGWLPKRKADLYDFQADFLGLCVSAVPVFCLAVYLLIRRRHA